MYSSNIYSANNALSGDNQEKYNKPVWAKGGDWTGDEAWANNATATTTTPKEPSFLSSNQNNPQLVSGLSAAGAIGQGALTQGSDNPVFNYFDEPGTIAATWAYDKADVETQGNKFDDAYASQYYDAGENVYDYGAGEGARVLGASVLDGFNKGMKSGNIWGGVGGAIGGAIGGGFRNIISKRKAREFDELAEQERQQYAAAQRNYFENNRLEMQNIARQQELARRSQPNYTTSIYNI